MDAQADVIELVIMPATKDARELVWEDAKEHAKVHVSELVAIHALVDATLPAMECLTKEHTTQ